MPRKSARLDQEKVYIWSKKNYTLGPRKSIRLDQEKVHVWEKKSIRLGQ